MTDVVGLRFVSEGDQQVINAIQRVDKAQQGLQRTSQALGKAIERGSATQEMAIRAYIALERAGVSYVSVLKGVEQNERMAAEAAQYHVNQLLGLDSATKSAKDSAQAMAQALREQEAAAARVAPAINELLRIDAPFRSAAQSAEAFSAELRKQEAATAAAARATQEFYQDLLKIDQPYASAEASAAAFVTELRKQDAATAATARATQEFYQELLKVDQPFRSAEASAQAFVTELRKQDVATAATARATQEFYQELLKVDQPFRSAEASAQAFVTELRKQEVATAAAARATQEFYRDLLKIDQPYRSAAASADVFAEAQQRASASYGQLRAAIDPAYAAQMRMKQAHDVVKQALAQEVITREEAARTLAAYRTQAQQTSTVLQGQAGATMFASRAQNASGMAMQQVGYQVGDFLVQVQSGTNAMVAFGQQATQLVGVLPMFGSVLGVSGTALIGLSAGLGIAIPLITAIGATIMRARENAGDAEDAFKGLGASLDALDNVRLDSLNKGIAEGAREAAREYERVLDLMERVELRALQSILQSQSSAVEEMIKTQDTLRNLAARGGLEFDFEVMGLDTYNEAIFLATQLRTLTGETREELLQQLAAMEEALTLRGAMTPQVEELIAKLAEEVGLVEAAAEASERKLDIFAQEARSYEQAIALQRMSLQFGEDSAAVRRLENQQAQENLALRLREQGLSEEQVSKLVEMLGVQQQLEGELRASEDAAMGLTDALKEAASAMASLLNVGSLEAKLAGLVAETRAITTGADAASASFVASELAKAAAMRDAALAEGAIPSRIVNQAYEERVGIVGQIGEATTARNAARDAARPGRSGGGGGRGGAVREQEDYLKNLLLEAQHKQRLVGLTEEQTRRQELLFEMEKRKLPIDEERIAMIVATESYTRSLMEAEEQRMQMMQTVEGHIENAFMSFVDGSATVEEAFKGMLRNILLAVYQQEVAKPAASAVSTLFRGLLGFANGGAFNKGVEFFADGGVVGSPTMFQHSGGLGVMGEAGPEAIMPLKRGANGKLGVQMDGAAGGDVTVNQYFQVSANGDESVRRIVRQEAPRMAEMAKSAVVDAKRRGGTYGRSF